MDIVVAGFLVLDEIASACIRPALGRALRDLLPRFAATMTGTTVAQKGPQILCSDETDFSYDAVWHRTRPQRRKEVVLNGQDSTSDRNEARRWFRAVPR